MVRERGEEVERQDGDDEAVEERTEHGQPDAQRATEEGAGEVAVGDVVLDLVDDVVLVVEPLDLPVALELVEPVRHVVGQRADLVGDDRHDRDQEERQRRDHGEDHGEHGVRPAHAAPLEEADGGVEAGRQEERDHDQHQRRADGLDLHREPDRDQHAEAADEADVERRVVVERWTGLAEVVLVRRGRRRSSSSCSGSGCGRLRGVGSLLVLAEAGDDVAQRGELGGDGVAALGHPVHLGPDRGRARARPRRRRRR